MHYGKLATTTFQLGLDSHSTDGESDEMIFREVMKLAQILFCESSNRNMNPGNLLVTTVHCVEDRKGSKWQNIE